MVTFFLNFLFILLPKQSNRQGGARVVDLPARSFDLARSGVAPPLITMSSTRLQRLGLQQFRAGND